LKEHSFAKPDTIAVDLRIVDRSQLRLADFDGDGTADIIVRDAVRGSIGWLKGNKATFEIYRPLCRAQGRVFFEIGDINGDGIMELAVVLSEQGVLKIYDGAALLKASRETIQ